MKKLICMLVVLGVAGMASAAILDNFESYADSAALNAAWVVNTGGDPMTETLVNESGNQVMKLVYTVNAPYWSQTKYQLPGSVLGVHGVNWTYQGFTSLTFNYKITDVGSGVIYFSAYDCWGQKILGKDFPATTVTNGWVSGTVDFVANKVAGMNLENLAVVTFGANQTWYSTPTGDLFIDDVILVPEPATMSVLALGGLLLRKRK
jgi:hypothetical protein